MSIFIMSIKSVSLTLSHEGGRAMLRNDTVYGPAAIVTIVTAGPDTYEPVATQRMRRLAPSDPLLLLAIDCLVTQACGREKEEIR